MSEGGWALLETQIVGSQPGPTSLSEKGLPMGSHLLGVLENEVWDWNTPLCLQWWEAPPQEVENTTGERVPFDNNVSTVYGRTKRPPLSRVTNHSLWHRWGECYLGNSGLKSGPRAIPFLKCPRGHYSPILATPIPCRFEYTSSSDWVWGLGGKES